MAGHRLHAGALLRPGQQLADLPHHRSGLAGFDREALRLALAQENIESRPLWKPMHLQPVFADCPAYVTGVSERLFAMGLCLPSGTGMREQDLERVVGRVLALAGAEAAGTTARSNGPAATRAHAE